MKKKDVELMNRFELINEVGRLYSQQTIIAQYFDTLGQQPGMKMWLDVADDLRCNRLITPKFHQRASRRNVSDRRVESQGRRKKTRRS